MGSQSTPYLTLLPLLLLQLGASPLGVPAQASDSPAQESPVIHMGRAFLFRADLEAARASRWLTRDASDEDALEVIKTRLEDRLRMAGRFVEAQVHLEADGGFAVVFVGHQDQRMEQFIIAGLSEPGLVSCRVVAEDQDLPGTDLAAERALLEAWCATHRDRALSFFHELPRDQGGPHAAIEWLAPYGSEVRFEAIPLLRGREVGISHREAEKLHADPREGEDRFSLIFVLKEGFLEKLRAFHAENEGRQRAIVLDEWVVNQSPMEAPEGPRFRVEGAFSIEAVRAIVFSTMGEPLPARLVFQGFGKRPLLHVKPD